MEFTRIYAFAVSPQKTSEDDEREIPEGGSMTLTSDIRVAMASAMRKSKLHDQCSVEFSFDDQSRSNETRDLLLQIMFGQTKTPLAAAEKLASRLADVTDHRSASSLLVIAVAKSGSSKVTQITLWAFPSEEAFQFKKKGSGAHQITYLTDIFSQNSKLRKAALFEGTEAKRGQVILGRVLDNQTTNSIGRGADFWIGEFLRCKLAITSELGTRTLASTLRKAFEKSPREIRDELIAGANALRASNRKVWSIQAFVTEYLSDEAKKVVMVCIKNKESHRSSFEIDKEVFDKVAGFRVFSLENDISVIAPFDAIGKQVKIFDGEDRKLVCEGKVIGEKVKSKPR